MIKNIVLFGTLIVLLCALGYSHYSREINYQTHITNLSVKLYQARVYARTFEDKSERLTKQIARLKQDVKIRDELLKEMYHQLKREKKLLVYRED